MVDKYKGIIEVEIAGAKRGFKFGTRAMLLFAEMENISLKEVDQRLKDGGTKEALNFYYCGALSYAKLMKIDEPTFDELCAWIDEYGDVNMQEKMSEAVTIPNSEAPTT